MVIIVKIVSMGAGFKPSTHDAHFHAQGAEFKFMGRTFAPPRMGLSETCTHADRTYIALVPKQSDEELIQALCEPDGPSLMVGMPSAIARFHITGTTFFLARRTDNGKLVNTSVSEVTDAWNAWMVSDQQMRDGVAVNTVVVSTQNVSGESADAVDVEEATSDHHEDEGDDLDEDDDDNEAQACEDEFDDVDEESDDDDESEDDDHDDDDE